MSAIPDPPCSLAVLYLAGCCIGLLFDISRAAAHPFRRQGMVLAARDFLYWLAVAPVVCAGLFFATGGDVRISALLVMGLGVSSYLLLASPLLLSPMKWLALCLHEILSFITRYTIYGLCLPAKGVWWLLGPPARWMQRLIERCATPLVAWLDPSPAPPPGE